MLRKLAGFLSVAVLPCLAQAQSPPLQIEDATLATLIHSESQGQAVRRRDAIDASSSSAPLDHWQIGELKNDSSWCSVYELDSRVPESIMEYRKIRDERPLDVEQHRRLARWCQKNKLPIQSRAHYQALVTLSPDDMESRQALGHKQIDGVWYSPDDLKKAGDMSKRLLNEWQQWMPEMKRLVKSMNSTDIEQRVAALEELNQMNELSAISSLEMVALQLDSDSALPFVRAISRIHSVESCLALTRIALAYPTDKRGELAIDSLKAYPAELYVGEILSQITLPVEVQSEYALSPRGELMIHLAMFSENRNEKTEVQLNRLVHVSDVSVFDLNVLRNLGRQATRLVAGRLPVSAGVAAKLVARNNLPHDEIQGAKNAVADEELLRKEISLKNRVSALETENAYVVLRSVTGQSLESQPEAWWNWWREYNERSLEKTSKRYLYEVKDKARTIQYVPRFRYGLSCLAKDTPIQTATGLVAVDQIKVGDMVVSQDVESGELALKPVIQTTVRPPKNTRSIVTDAGTIQATDGHRWFVAGKGWLMTKELKADMVLHNVTGTTKILDVKQDEGEQPTYNLVVEDFHTYFVGSDRVLSFDNSEPIGTLRSVPGYGSVAANP